MSRKSDIAQIREARALWLAKEGMHHPELLPPANPNPPPKKHRRRRHGRGRGIDSEQQRLDAIARWLVDEKT